MRSGAIPNTFIRSFFANSVTVMMRLALDLAIQWYNRLSQTRRRNVKPFKPGWNMASCKVKTVGQELAQGSPKLNGEWSTETESAAHCFGNQRSSHRR